MDPRPIIGITTDIADGKAAVGRSHASLVAAAGGLPVLLPCEVTALPGYLELCDGFILTGGDDPDTRVWGIPLHPRATPVHPDRQAFEWGLLEAIRERPGVAVLGVCLGMQLMAVHAGGELDQHLPDTLPTAADHWGRKEHPVDGELGEGIVHSHHRQAIVDPGVLRVVAAAPDGVIEAVNATDRGFYLGVQWHPERTRERRLGADLVRGLVTAASGAVARASA